MNWCQHNVGETKRVHLQGDDCCCLAKTSVNTPWHLGRLPSRVVLTPEVCHPDIYISMAKRGRSPLGGESWSDGGTSNAATDSESDFDDASFAQKSKSLRSRKRTATVARDKAKVSRNGASTSSAPQRICADFTPHSKSVHSISSPVMVRNALLAWYKTVHDTRGMPWRRPYDPNLGPEERAQRAYEVLELSCGLCTWIDSYYLLILCRFGSRRSCCNKHKLPQSSLIITAGWQSVYTLLSLSTLTLNVTLKLHQISHNS